jgi:hypothetical protein
MDGAVGEAVAGAPSAVRSSLALRSGALIVSAASTLRPSASVVMWPVTVTLVLGGNWSETFDPRDSGNETFCPEARTKPFCCPPGPVV